MSFMRETKPKTLLKSCTQVAVITVLSTLYISSLHLVLATENNRNKNSLSIFFGRVVLVEKLTERVLF